jgi:hypothetical protein
MVPNIQKKVPVERSRTHFISVRKNFLVTKNCGCGTGKMSYHIKSATSTYLSVPVVSVFGYESALNSHSDGRKMVKNYSNKETLKQTAHRKKYFNSEIITKMLKCGFNF